MPKRREALRADAVQSPLGKIKQFASDTPPAPAAVWSLRKKAGYFLAGKQNLPIFAPHYGNAVHPHFLSLFHGVMVSTRVFGSLSPRSSRSGTTAKEKRFCVQKRGTFFCFYASGMTN